MVSVNVNVVRRNDGLVGVGHAYLAGGDDAVADAEVDALVTAMDALPGAFTYSRVSVSTAQSTAYADYDALLAALPLSVTTGGELSAWTPPATDTRRERRAHLYQLAREFLAGYNPSMTGAQRNAELTRLVQKYLSACAEDANLDSDARYGALEETFKLDAGGIVPDAGLYAHLAAGPESSPGAKDGLEWDLASDASTYQTPTLSGDDWVPTLRSAVTFSAGFATAGNANEINIWQVLG